MAEIHVQTKKNSSGNMWIWIILGLILIAAAVYFMMRNNKTDLDKDGNKNTTSRLIVSQPAVDHQVTYFLAA